MSDDESSNYIDIENNNMLQKIDIDSESKNIKINMNHKSVNNDNASDKNCEDDFLNNRWNYETKLSLKKLGEKSMGYRWMHHQESIYYYNKYKKINKAKLVLLTIITSLSSTSLISILADVSVSTDQKILNIIVVILTLLLDIIVGHYEQTEPHQQFNDQRSMSHKFMTLYHSIKEQFSLNYKDRDDGAYFLKSKIKEYDDLMESPLNIRNITLQRYINATKDNNIYKPNIIGAFEEIDIENHNNDDNNIAININQKDDKVQYEINRWLHNF